MQIFGIFLLVILLTTKLGFEDLQTMIMIVVIVHQEIYS